MSVTGVLTTPGTPGAGLRGRPPLLVLPPPMLAPLPQPHRHLDCLVVGGVDRGHTLDRHPLPLQIEITLDCERIFSLHTFYDVRYPYPSDQPRVSQDGCLEHLASGVGSVLYGICLGLDRRDLLMGVPSDMSRWDKRLKGLNWSLFMKMSHNFQFCFKHSIFKLK